MAKQEKSAKAEIKQWLREHIARNTEVRLPDLTDEAMTHFKKDAAFVKKLFTEGLRELVYEAAQSAVAASRGNLIAFGDTLITPDGVKEKARKGFFHWLEHVKDRHIRVGDMTHEDLLIAARERRERGNHEHSIAMVWEVMAPKLKDGEKVSDVFKEDDIEKIRANIEKELKAA